MPILGTVRLMTAFLGGLAGSACCSRGGVALNSARCGDSPLPVIGNAVDHHKVRLACIKIEEPDQVFP